MPASLSELLAPKTNAQFLRQILAAIQGVGHTQRLVGSGLGLVYGSGAPTSAQTLYVKVATSGGLGTAAFQYSLDGGNTYSGLITVPASGVYALSSLGFSLNFDVSNASSVANPYIAGDVYAIALTVTNVPVTAWQPGSTPLTLLETDSDINADLSQLILAVAAGGYVSTAKSDWLDLLAANVYNLQRTQARYTAGVLTFSAVPGVGPYTFVAGDRTVATVGGVQFVTTSGGVLAGGGTLQVTAQAVVAGKNGNQGNGTITQMLTPLAGVTVNNPDPGSGTWITAYGDDAESDDSLAQRCKDRWPTLGIGATAASYDSWARAATPNITRTNPYTDPVVPGQVDVVVAGPSGPVNTADVTAAQAYINARIPLTTSALVINATAVPVNVVATVYVSAAYLSVAQQQCPANLQALIAATPLGGTVYLSEIIAALTTPTGVRNVVVSSPGADVVLTAAQVATLTQTLTYTVVA